MNRKTVCPVLTIILGCVLFLSACALGDRDTTESSPLGKEGTTETSEVQGTTEASDDKAKTPTGYPKGEVQRAYLYLRGKLWEPADELPEPRLDAAYVLVGQIESVENKHVPSKEGAAAHLQIGQKLFGNEKNDVLFLEMADGRYRKYVPYLGDPADIEPSD